MTSGARGACRRRYCPDLGNAGWAGLEPRLLLSLVVAKPEIDRIAAVETRAALSFGPGRTFDRSDAIVYIPKGVVESGQHPAIVAFTPDGNSKRTVKTLAPIANQNRWIIYASKSYSNRADQLAYPEGYKRGDGTTYDRFVAAIKAQIDEALSELPVDRSRIILSGFSGGGYFALELNARYPGLAAAVIDNAGGTAEQYGLRFERRVTSEGFAGSRRLAVFLASPQDRRFSRDAKVAHDIYRGLGWQTLFLNFRGGHIEAPTATYRRAVAWIVSRSAWRTP